MRKSAGGLIHVPMYERLLLCQFAVADLTTANANVFYELGIRHAVRPWSTVLVFADGARLPFDVAPLRGLRYPVTEAGVPRDVDTVRQTLTARLIEAKKAVNDSPLFQALPGFQAPDLKQLASTSFYDRARSATLIRDRLDSAIKLKQLDGLRSVETEIGDLSQQDSGLILALYYSYPSVGAWTDMVRLLDRMPDYVADSVPVQEQYALALNRMGEDARAERVLLELIERRGPSSETFGMLGRVYKDRWQKAENAGKAFVAQGFLEKAIDSYVRGFEADPRDFYPGVNAVTLMAVREPTDGRLYALGQTICYELRVGAEVGG